VLEPIGNIPRADAEELMAHHCLRGELAKTRYFVPYGPLTWQIDVYKGILAGVILAEVELPSEIVEPPIPAWVGREVTGNPDYKKINMVNARYRLSKGCLASPYISTRWATPTLSPRHRPSPPGFAAVRFWLRSDLR
jgi:hypothetical protein